jgi:hypothetical protein
MRRQTKKVIAQLGLVAVLAMGAWLVWSAKSGDIKNTPVTVTTTASLSAEPAPATLNSLQDIEERREQELEAKREAAQHEKLKLKQENSVECQFWKQQKLHSSAESVDEKIKQFCTI